MRQHGESYWSFGTCVEFIVVTKEKKHQNRDLDVFQVLSLRKHEMENISVCGQAFIGEFVCH